MSVRGRLVRADEHRHERSGPHRLEDGRQLGRVRLGRPARRRRLDPGRQVGGLHRGHERRRHHHRGGVLPGLVRHPHAAVRLPDRPLRRLGRRPRRAADAVNVFNAVGDQVTGVTFGAASTTSPIATFDNTAGGSTLSTLSQVGVNGAFLSANGSEIGSPAGATGPTPPPPPTPPVVVSEVAPWGSSNTPYAADWFELTNTGSTGVDLTGWTMDDNSNFLRQLRGPARRGHVAGRADGDLHGGHRRPGRRQPGVRNSCRSGSARPPLRPGS